MCARVTLVAVIGPSVVEDSALLEMAEDVGRSLAQAGFGVLTGGTSGVMEAASRGASSVGGVTVGITPSADPEEANAHVGIVIASGSGEGRNVLIVNSVRALVVVGTSHGTLSEVALALREGKLVVALRGYGKEIDEAIRCASSVEEAVGLVRDHLGDR